jgi:hypothetical protein
MISDADLHRLLASQPLSRMRHLASLLGWNGLQLEYLRVRDSEANSKVPQNTVVVFYTTTDSKFFLQINTYPHGQSRTHQATVNAERYGITSVGWHQFELPDDEDLLVTTAEALKRWLYRPLFKDRQWVRQLLKENPNMATLGAARKRKR